MVKNSIAHTSDIFQIVKEIPFPGVQRAFNGAEPRRDKIPCPFHQEKTASFHVYPDGYKCFGCGEAGDSVDFVAAIYDLQKFEAAKAICEKFNIPYQEKPLSKQGKLKLAKAKAERARQKRLQEAFENWSRQATRLVRGFTEAIRLQLEEKGLEIDENLLPLVHRLPLFEWWADILAQGTEAEKIELYRNPDFRRWFNCSR